MNIKTIKTTFKLATLAAVFTVLQGCATTPANTVTITPTGQTASMEDVLHRIQPHERLGDIAMQYTGDVTKWKDIAHYNGISDPTYVHDGTAIWIPAALMQASYHENTIADANNVAVSRSNTRAIKRKVTKTRSDAVLESVIVNRTFELTPMTESSFSSQASTSSPLAKVQIVGSYYPKGIYQQPASYSELVMRAAPGAVFELEYLANNWYKIVTENGIGYLRQDDGKIVTLNVQN